MKPLPGHIWRPLHPVDVPALRQLLAECALIDGSTTPSRQRDVVNLESDTIAAVANDGRIAAYAWLTARPAAHEQRIFIDGRVHPDYRGKGVGRAVMAWSEARAREMLPERGVLRVDYYDRDTDATHLYERFGFRFAFAEDEMIRSLSDLPDATMPDGYRIRTWDDSSPGAFFGVYHSAFKAQLGFPNWPEDVWVANFTNDPAFRGAWSLLLHDAQGQPVAYTICHIKEETVGYIVQMGVAPTARRRGLGTALLTETMRYMRQGGMTTAALDVNIGNAPARALYHASGFQQVRCYHSYQKIIAS